MWLNIRKFSLAVFLVSFLSLNLALTPPLQTCEESCRAQVKCSSEPPLAWMTDGTNFKVFRNACHARNYNCQRLERDQCLLVTTTEKKSLKNCKRACSKELDPVCTEYNGKSKEFANHCLWAQAMCETGQAYVYQFEGKCPVLKGK